MDVVLAYFSANGAPALALSPTLDLWEAVGGGTQVLSSEPMVEVGNGWYQVSSEDLDPSIEYVGWAYCDAVPAVEMWAPVGRLNHDTSLVLAVFFNNAAPASGLTPTITIRQMDGTAVVSASMTACAAAGWYRYDFSAGRVATTAYVANCDAGDGLSDAERWASVALPANVFQARSSVLDTDTVDNLPGLLDVWALAPTLGELLDGAVTDDALSGTISESLL